jgi:hypothetical protein
MRADALESLQDALRNGRDVDVCGDGANVFLLRWLEDATMIQRLVGVPGIERSRVGAAPRPPLINYKRLRIMADLLQSSPIAGLNDWGLRLAQVTILDHDTAAPFAHWSVELWTIGKMLECRLADTLVPFAHLLLTRAQSTVAVGRGCAHGMKQL